MEKPSSHYDTIEITIVSAEALLLNKKQPVKKNAYIIVKIDPYDTRSTSMDAEGGSYPTWNEKFVMDLPGHVRFITLEARSGSSKVLGTVHVPVSDFSGGHLPDKYLSFLSYRLRDGNGDKNGIVNFSVKVVKRSGGGGSGGGAASCSHPWMGVPVISGGGVVTGVPVKNRY